MRIEEFRPVLRAYALSYATSSLPRVPDTINKATNSRLSFEQKLALFRKLLLAPAGIDKFPTACAIIVAGSTVLPRRLEKLLNFLLSRTAHRNESQLRGLLSRALLPLSSFWCAWLSFYLLNKDHTWSRKRAASLASRSENPDKHHPPPEGFQVTYAGKTIDLTLFAFCRAIDIVIITAWIKTRKWRMHPDNIAPRSSLILCSLMDPAVFATSSAVIMWAWFFSPERLPATYNRWIAKIAQIDSRLVSALRLCRRGDFVYGSPDTQDANLPSLCKELDMPQSWGNPAVTIPVPCVLYHCGAGKSCEIHAGKRFIRTFISAIRLYLPLQLLGLLRKSGLRNGQIPFILKSAARSSAFLASFVSLFYYFVCLTRTRIGPSLFPSLSPQRWDSGLCVLAGCLACGWSIMLEKAGRRQEIAFFVAPRALATTLPRLYNKKYQRREQVVFACSVAVLMTTIQHSKTRVRGVLGNVLGSIVS